MSPASLPVSRILPIASTLSTLYTRETNQPNKNTTITPYVSGNSSYDGATSAPTSQNTSTPSTTPHHLKYADAAAYPYYITLTITRSSGTYVTLVPLGNSFPTSSSATSPHNTIAQTPGISTGSIVGIIVGCILAFGMLAGVFYVYALRARGYQRRRRRGWSSRKTTSSGTRSRRSRRSSSGAGPAPPPPEGVFPPAGEP